MDERAETPLPWRLSDSDLAVILASDHTGQSDVPYAVAFCAPCVPQNGEDDYGQFNAAFIVHAVNLHDEMVEALREADRLLAETGFAQGTGHAKIRSALSKALPPPPASQGEGE